MKHQICADEEFAQFLLGEAQDAQTRFWSTLSALERQLSVELNSTKDLENTTLDRLLTDPEMWETSSIPKPTWIFNDRELHTMLYSLRMLQNKVRNAKNPSCQENGVSDHIKGENFTILTIEEIDYLCERLTPA